MAYLGEHLYHCPRVPYNWRQTQVIVVSGDGPNFCGHALLSAGDYYFHIDGRNDRPFYLNEAGYRRFLKENNKREIQRKWIPLRDPDGAQKRPEELSVKNWRFTLFSHNCVAYIEEILKAGGSKVRNLLSCPVTKWE
jgi:hypothetical protein